MAIRGNLPDPEQWSPVEWAYAAGFIDGEGHIGITRADPKPNWRSRNTTPVYNAVIVAVGTVREPMAWLHERFKGSLIPRNISKASRKPQWKYTLTEWQAYAFCRGVLPYLLVKQRQAALLIEFMETKALTPKRYKAEVPPEELARRESYRQQMIVLNDSWARRSPHRLTEGAPMDGDAVTG